MDLTRKDIRALLLEDNPLDAELIRTMLAQAHPGAHVTWVRTRREYEAAIAEAYDVILCDYNLPDYTGLDALTAARERHPLTPVIVVTGTLSEDEAVQCIKAGATDYMLKDSLQRLGPSVSRALREAADARDKAEAEAALRVSEARLQLALQASEISVWEYDVGSGHVAFSRQLGPMLGYEPGEVPARLDAWEALTHPSDVKRLRVELARHYRGESEQIDIEYRVRAKNGQWRWLQTLGRAVGRDANGLATRMSGTHVDITERRRAQELLRLQKQAIDAATNAIIIVDAHAHDFPIVYVNPAFRTITGYAPQEVVGRNCRFLQARDRDQPDLERLRQAIALGADASVLLRNYRRDGTLFWNNLRISPLKDDGGAVTHFVGILSDVTAVKNYQTELEYQANYDTLTGLANRNLLQDRLRQAIGLAERNARQCAVLYIDLDRLKLVNDSLGQASGDELLKAVAARLAVAVHETDTVARLRGDEFAVILQELDHESRAAAIAHRILQAVQQPLSINGHDLFVAASIGVCVCPADGRDGDTLLKHATTAMYRAKQGGGNRVCFYTEGLNSGALARLRLEGDLRRAIAQHEFELHYQPRVALDSGRITSVEALVRWRRGDALVAPGEFIPLAEETGLIDAIGEWVLHAACVQMRLWRDGGWPELRVAVNLSPRQLRQPDLVQRIRAILAETGLESRCLELEITESAAMQDPRATQEILEQLAAIGIAHAIDDFGTGYSSLAYLKRFPIDYLKIDQSFVRGLPHDANDDNIVRAIIALGRSLEVTVIAEGVETAAQREFLRAHGCHEMQGFLFCGPQPAESLDRLLRRYAGPRIESAGARSL